MKDLMKKIIFAENKLDKIKLDKTDEITDTSTTAPKNETDLAEKIKSESISINMFNPTLYAYAVHKVENKFDIMKVSIDPENFKSAAELLGKKYDSESRAYMELQSLMAADLVKKRKEEHVNHKQKGR
jgi:hypothetical protein